jgi:ribosomal protein L11 methyltransferase
MEQPVQSVCINLSPDRQDMMIALLCDLGYDGFEQSDDHLIAYIPVPDFDSTELNNLLNSHQLTASLSIIEKTNWNAVWEQHFQPIQLGSQIGVRAHFHPPMSDVTHELIITPQMSFGTGHHATTSMMLEILLEQPVKNASVLDFGSGTGILAILARKLGATEVVAIDNDPWCIENATDNGRMNDVELDIRLSEVPPDGIQFDLVLANINLHIIQAHLRALVNCLLPHGTLLLSGLLVSDAATVDAACTQIGLHKTSIREKNGWLALSYRRVS